MKNIIFSSLLFCLILFASCSVEQKNALKEMDLNGKVKSLKKITYNAVMKFGKIEKVNIQTQDQARLFYSEFDFISYYNGDYYEIFFNQNGNIVEKNFYNQDSSLITKMIYEYNDKGNLIRRNNYDSDGSLNKILICKNDNNGNIIEQSSFFPDSSGGVKKLFFKRDSKGNIIKKEKFDSNGNITEKYTFKYDSTGNIIAGEKYISEDSLKTKWQNQFDEKGNIVNWNWIEYKSDSTVYNKITIKYKYNNKSDIIEESHNRLKNGSWIFKYHYDKKRNWIKETTFLDDKVLTIRERQIEYY